MVSVNTFKFYSVLYDRDGYAAVASNGSTSFVYEGVCTKYDPHIIPFSELQAITSSTNSPTFDGDVNGVRANSWRTNSVTIARSTTNPDVRIGLIIYKRGQGLIPYLSLIYYPGTGNVWTNELSIRSGDWAMSNANFYNNRMPAWFWIGISNVSTAGYVIYENPNETRGYRSAFNPLSQFWGNCQRVTEAPDPNPIPLPETDPYKPGGTAYPGGGTGDFDGTGDDIDIPGLPSLSATDTGFITLFNPSAGELHSLANYMWSGAFDLDTFRKIFANPMDCILGLSIVPVSVPNGDSRTVTVGNISTGVSMATASQQYVEVDCGTLNVNEYWGAYLDYDPYTKAEIYLPYIGTHPLAVDDIMGKSVTVKYHVDILSGACTAFVKCGGSVLYEFIGQCSSSIPVSGNDWTNVINGVLTVAGAIGSMVATGGATAPMAASTIASTAVNSMKPNVEKSGSMSGTGGMLAVQTPYLILTRPRQARAEYQNQYTGYPSFITRQLSEISGYTEIESIHLDGIPATKQELTEIENLLKGGVIL